MAIVMVMDVPGGTLEQYEQVNETLGIAGSETAPAGLVGHVCAKTEDGVLIVDVWESEQALHAFFETGGLGAALKQAGVPAVQPRIYPVHNGLRGRDYAA